MVWILGLELGKIFSFARLSKRTTRRYIRKQNLAGRIKNLRSLRHKMNSTKNYYVIVALFGLLSQSQAITYIIRKILYLLPLIIMTQYYSILFFFKANYFALQFFCVHNIYICIIFNYSYHQKQWFRICKYTEIN